MECKQAAQCSDLDIAVCLLREALERRQAPHRHRSDSLNGLAVALVARFLHMGHPEDLDEAVCLAVEAVKLEQHDLEREALVSQPHVCMYTNLVNDILTVNS